ncbi:hypothetical protein [Xanthobacter sp. 126]|nr:hypothetical protein [Xanthobacter sp. 126]
MARAVWRGERASGLSALLVVVDDPFAVVNDLRRHPGRDHCRRGAAG